MRKNHEVTIKLNKEELEIIRKKAKILGLPVSTFLRMIGLNANITPPEFP